MVRIEIDGEPLELSSEFSLDIEESNPVFNEIGSQTIPATVPSTPKNNRLTGFCYRLDAALGKQRLKGDCRVISGSYCRNGMFNVTSASRINGITFNIGFDNSTAYAKWQGKKLTDLISLPVWDSYGDDRLKDGDDGGVSYYIDELYRHSVDNQDPLAIFPVVVEIQNDGDNPSNYVFLNIPYNGGFKSSPKTVFRVIDGKKTQVSVPARYGITPFVRVWYIVNAIFEDLGLEVISNPFRFGDLARLVVLNNVADSLCANKIDFSELMPDCTVEEFLNSLWVRFGFVYNLDYDAMTADLRLVKDVISAAPVADLSDRITDFPDITFESARYVVMSAQTSFEGAAPATERFEDFMKGYDVGDVYITTSPSATDGHKLSFVPVTCTWVKTDVENATQLESSSSFFRWDPMADDMEAFELSSNDECLPMIKYGGISESGASFVPLYLAGSRHYHSFIKGSDESGSSEEESTPLAFMWAFTNTDQYPAETIGRLGAEIGEGESLTKNKTPFHTTSLLFQFKNGLYDCFWKRFDQLLCYDTRYCEVKMRLPKTVVRQINVLNPVTFNGAKCLFDTIRYSLSDKTFLDVEAKLRPISSDFGLDEVEWLVPDFNLITSRHGWRLVSSMLTKTYKTPESCRYAVEMYKRQFGNPEFNARDGYARLAATPVSVRAVGLTWDKDPQWMATSALSRGETATAEYNCEAKYAMRLQLYKNKSSRPYQIIPCGNLIVNLAYEVVLVRV